MFRVNLNFLYKIFRILETKNAFIALDSVNFINNQDSSYLKQKCKRFRISCLISEHDFCGKFEHWNVLKFEEIQNLNLFIATFNFEPIKLYSETLLNLSCTILYAIQTSGTSGEPKCVHVPNTAIMYNIIDFV